VPAQTEGVVEAPLASDPDGSTHLQMRVDPAGRPASSRWRLERAFARHALLAMEPLTGRTHQLRVHAAHLGHPIVCDHLYGDLRPVLRSDAIGATLPLAEDAVLLDRLGLHARRLELDHPLTGERLRFESPLPRDLAAAVDALDALARAPAGERAG
jgi:23S rRNA-/tRNA-specific pseudouridylate synthase